jgi:hypothetical protein
MEFPMTDKRVFIERRPEERDYIARQLGWPVSDSKDGRSLRGRKMALLALRGTLM